MQYVWYSILAIIFCYYALDIAIQRRETSMNEKFGRVISCAGTLALVTGLFVLTNGIASWLLAPVGLALDCVGAHIEGHARGQRIAAIILAEHRQTYERTDD